MGDYYWKLRVKKEYDPSQPRVPAGSPEGGRWTAGGELNQADYSRIFKKWPVYEDTFIHAGNAVKVRRWLRQNAPDGWVTVNEGLGREFIQLAARLRDGRLIASVISLSGGPGYEINMTEFKR